MDNEQPVVKKYSGKGIGLRWALLVYIVLPLTAAMGFVGYQSLRTLETWIEQHFQQELSLISRTLQLPLSGAIKRYDRDALDEALESAFRLNRVFGVHLYDIYGRSIASVGEEETESLPAHLLGLALQGTQQGEYGQMSGQTVYSHFAPLRDGGQTIGVLQVTRRASDLEDYIASLRGKALLGVVGATVIITALVLLGHYLAIGNPLSNLLSSIARVTAGNRQHRTSIRGPRELALLGIALNQMLDSINHAEQEIEQRHHIQAELERRLQRAETMASLGRLAGGVAHELGTPLSIVDGKAQRLLRRQDCPVHYHEPLQAIRKEVRRMEQIVRQLLEFGRSQSSHRRTMAADRLAEMAVNAVRDAFAESNTRLTLAGPKPAPLLSVNPMRMEQALVNLLHNARQAALGGQVQLSWFSTGERIGFRVEDDGPGIPDTLKQRIIEPFFTTKEVGQGSGLGLTIVDSVAEEHDGTLEVVDSILGGAGFVLYLPRVNAINGDTNAKDVTVA